MKKNKPAGIIYTAECKVTGEFYVGATTDSVKQRKLDHVERANRGEAGKFQQAISTYGAAAFNWQQIDTASTINELAQKEKQYIVEYKAKEKGFNSDAGGGIKKTVYQYSIADGSLINSYSSLQNAANAVSAGKTSIGNACNGQTKTCKGYYWSYSLTEPYVCKTDLRKKTVLQLTTTGEQVAVFESVAEASKATGISKTCISRVCRGERSQSSGYVWKYI